MASNQESQASEGLAIHLYPFKWKKAQELAEVNERSDDNRLLPYWEQVRLIYLELGGEYRDRSR